MPSTRKRAKLAPAAPAKTSGDKLEVAFKEATAIYTTVEQILWTYKTAGCTGDVCGWIRSILVTKSPEFAGTYVALTPAIERVLSAILDELSDDAE